MRRRLLMEVLKNMGITIGNNEYPRSFEAMFYALENGIAKIGTFTLDTPLPNTETLIIETELSEIHGVMFLAEGFPEIYDDGSKQTTGFSMATHENGAFTHCILVYRTNVNSAVGNSSDFYPVPQGTMRIDGGNVYCTAKFNANINYTPFEAGIKYRWVVW